MSRAQRSFPVLLGLALLAWAVQAAALDLSGPKKVLDRILGHTATSGSSNAGPSQASGPRNPAGTISTTESKTIVPGASAALPDTSEEREILDNILLSPEPYYYQSVGRRDPFESPLDQGGGREEDGPLVSQLTVVGILWGEHDRFALMQDGQERSFIIREGDRHGSFSVTKVEPDGVVLYVTEYGVGRTLRLPLAAEWKGSKNARDGN